MHGDVFGHKHGGPSEAGDDVADEAVEVDVRAQTGTVVVHVSAAPKPPRPTAWQFEPDSEENTEYGWNPWTKRPYRYRGAWSEHLWCWELRDVGWWGGFLFLVGSVLFVIGSVGACLKPVMEDKVKKRWLYVVPYALGANLYLYGAILLVKLSLDQRPGAPLDQRAGAPSGGRETAEAAAAVTPTSRAGSSARNSLTSPTAVQAAQSKSLLGALIRRGSPQHDSMGSGTDVRQPLLSCSYPESFDSSAALRAHHLQALAAADAKPEAQAGMDWPGGVPPEAEDAGDDGGDVDAAAHDDAVPAANGETGSSLTQTVLDSISWFRCRSFLGRWDIVEHAGEIRPQQEVVHNSVATFYMKDALYYIRADPWYWTRWTLDLTGAVLILIGAILYGISCHSELFANLVDRPTEAQLFWLAHVPNVIGGVLFVTGSYCYWVSALRTLSLFVCTPRSLSWWLLTVNLCGSTGFFVGAAFQQKILDVWPDMLVPNWSELFVGYVLGSSCFLVGSWFMIIEIATTAAEAE